MERPFSILDWLGEIQTLHVVWGGLGVLTVWLLLLLVTRWGSTKSVSSYLFFSLLAHCLLGLYATTVMVVQQAAAQPQEPTFEIERVELTDATPSSNEPKAQPGDTTTLPSPELWDRLRAAAPIEPLSLEAHRPARPESFEQVRAPKPDEPLAAEAPHTESAVSALALPDPTTLVRSEARSGNVDGLPALEPEVLQPAQGKVEESAALPDAREVRRRPDANSSLPQRRVPVEAPPLSDAPGAFQPREPQRKPSEAVSPKAPLSGNADLSSRRGKADDLPPAPSASAIGQADSSALPTDPTTQARTLPTSPSLRRRPGLLVEPAARPKRPTTGLDRLGEKEGKLAGSLDPLAPALEAGALSAEPLPQPRTVAPAARSNAATPEIYRLRLQPQRSRRAVETGASDESELAVERALQWLAAHQSADGRWDADGFDENCPAGDRCTGPAGREERIEEQDREGAGATADTATTALALLAFLGAGHTQQRGKYQTTIARALHWLVQEQDGNGSLVGQANLYAAMYAHAIATMALGEAYGMTKDAALRAPLARAVEFIVASQDSASGGWRYSPGQQGDTSVLGWQLMALRSAEYAGVSVPSQTWQQARRFLRTVALGRAGGLAGYRPGRPASPAMTAEALTCHQILGRAASDRATQEAVEYLLRHKPDGASAYNLYYWYYGTLSVFQHGGEAWETWNLALRDLLSDKQNQQGHAQGSWDPTSYWASYGGRIYSTAMATMCLEVYYRYLPMYLQAGAPQRSGSSVSR